MAKVTDNGRHDAATHFGRQMRKERVAHGWSLREFSARAGVDFTVASRIETGRRPPNEAVARACDAVFPERNGWFADYYEESKSWVPAGFRSWGEYEDKAASLRSWTPGVVDGLLQTKDYARALLATAGAAEDVTAARLEARLARQQRVLYRAEPPLAWFVVDALSLYRRVGSADVMAAQCAHLARIAALPYVTVQVIAAVGHPAGASGFVVADSAAYAEHAFGGYVFTEAETVTAAVRLFTSIQPESDKASESLAMILEVGETWARGGSPATATPTAASA